MFERRLPPRVSTTEKLKNKARNMAGPVIAGLVLVGVAYAITAEDKRGGETITVCDERGAWAASDTVLDIKSSADGRAFEMQAQEAAATTRSLGHKVLVGAMDDSGLFDRVPVFSEPATSEIEVGELACRVPDEASVNAGEVVLTSWGGTVVDSIVQGNHRFDPTPVAGDYFPQAL